MAYDEPLARNPQSATLPTRNALPIENPSQSTSGEPHARGTYSFAPQREDRRRVEPSRTVYVDPHLNAPSSRSNGNSNDRVEPRRDERRGTAGSHSGRDHHEAGAVSRDEHSRWPREAERGPQGSRDRRYESDTRVLR